MRRRFVGLAAICAASVALAGCAEQTQPNASADPPSFCKEHAVLCVGAMVLAGGAIAYGISRSHSDESETSAPIVVSDARLKRDVQPLTRLDNGLMLYTFRFAGDDRRFVGVIAQDLLKDPRFASAVVRLPSAHYEVDYAAIGFADSDLAAMRAAGERALRVATGG